jgi:protein-L-isoaspartate(D-aspartate) O-methyltransferase
MSDAEKVISLAPKRMTGMLKSVYEYNNKLILKKSEERLLTRILFAMSRIDRKFFYEDEEEAYSDAALAIGRGQTISQPSTVARMLMLAGVEEGDDILEVGTGSGWNATLIAFLCYPGATISVERIYKLLKYAENNVAELRGNLKNNQPHEVEKISKFNMYAESIFKKGKAWKKKYDKIIVTAGVKEEQKEKMKNLAKTLLKKNGLLIFPMREGPMTMYQKTDGELKESSTKEKYVFVPLLEKGVEKE